MKELNQLNNNNIIPYSISLCSYIIEGDTSSIPPSLSKLFSVNHIKSAMATTFVSIFFSIINFFLFLFLSLSLFLSVSICITFYFILFLID